MSAGNIYLRVVYGGLMGYSPVHCPHSTSKKHFQPPMPDSRGRFIFLILGPGREIVLDPLCLHILEALEGMMFSIVWM